MIKHSIHNYNLIQKLGQGSFGEVYKIKCDNTQQILALKKIKVASMSQQDKKNALNQIRLLASCSGPHIIGFKDSFFDNASNSLCIVLQHAEQGDLCRKIKLAAKNKKFINEGQIWRALVHISRGLAVLHSNRVIHRDLKPANVFIMSDGTYKIGDLNISKVLKSKFTSTQTGTPYYTSPQIWKNQHYAQKVDLWSLGCLLYQMAAQRPPFIANDIKGLKKIICAGVYQKISNGYSTQLRKTIQSLLKLDPNKRPSALQLLNSQVVINQLNNFSQQESSNHVESQNTKLTTKINLLETIKLNNRNFHKVNLPRSKANSVDVPKTKAIDTNSGLTSRETRISVMQLLTGRSGKSRCMRAIDQSNILKVEAKNHRILSARGQNQQLKKQACGVMLEMEMGRKQKELKKLPPLPKPIFVIPALLKQNKQIK